MAQYNNNFELTIEDIELIENSLRNSFNELSSQRVSRSLLEAGSGSDADALDENVRQIQDLLGRLHNQKVFFRPRGTAYLSG